MDNTTQASSDFPPIKIPSSYDSDTENTKILNNNTNTSVSTSSTPVTEYSDDDDGGFETASERPIVDEDTLAKEDDIDDGDEKSTKGRVLEVEDDNFDLNELVEEFSELNEGVEEDKKVEILSGENLVNPSEVKRVGDEVVEGSKVEVLSGGNPVISDVEKIEVKGEEDKKNGDLNGENLVTPSEVKRVGDEVVEDTKIEVLSGENPVISDVEKVEVKGEEGVVDKKIGGLSGENLVTPSEVKRVGDVEEIKSNGDEVVEDSKIKALSGKNPVTSYAEVVKAKKIVDLNGENLVTPSEAKRVSDVDEIKSKVVEDTEIEALSGENLATALEDLEDKEVSDVGKVELKDEEAVEDKKIEALSGENSVAATDAKEVSDVIDEVAIPKIVGPAESKLVEPDSGGVTAEGDSVVEAIQVDLSAPGVAVVKQIDENEKSGQSSDVVEPADSKVADEADKTGVTTEEDSVVEAIQVDLSAPGVAVGKMDENEKNDKSAALINGSGQNSYIVEPTDSKLVDEGDKIEVTTEKDSVVEDIKVDVSAPEVAVVGEVDENEKIDESAALVNGSGQSRDIVEPAESKLAEADKTGVATEEDSVVEAIEVDLAAPGVVEESFVPKVVGVDAVIENKFEPLANDIVEPPKPEPIETVEPADSKLVDEADKSGVSTEGDSVVEAIQVDLAAPGVAVIAQTEENKEDDGSAVLINGPGQTNPIAEEAVASKVIGVDAVIKNKFDPLASHNVETPKQEPMESKSSAGKDEGLVSGAVVTDNAMASVGENMKNEEKPEKEIEVEADYEATHNRLDVDSSLKDELEEDGVLGKSVVNESAEPSSFVNRHVMLEDDDDEAKDDSDEEGEIEGMVSDGEIDGMIFGGSASAKPYNEEMERGSGRDSQSSRDHSQRIDGQIVTDSEEEGDTDDEEGDGKELFDSAALAALLKAATGAGSDNGNITITSQDGSRLFSVERPAGLGSSLQSLRPAPRPNRANLFTPSTLTTGGESDTNLSEEEKKKLEKLQSLRVKFLRIVQRLGLSLDESVAAQVLYRLALVAGRQTGQLFSLDAAKVTAQQLEAEGKEDLDFSVNILVIGKSGVGKSATINSIFGEEKAIINAFEPATATVREINGMVNGVKIRVFDTPGLKSSVMEQAFNRSVFASVKKLTKKNPPDIVLYVDRLDAQTRDLNDLPLLRTVTSSMGSSTWRSAIVTLTHAASAPPDGPGGSPLSYEVFVTQRSHVVQQSIGQAVGDLRMMSPSLMNPVTLVENHPSCRKNREGQKVLPNGQSWRPQLLLLCYSMKILSEASSLSKPQDPFDHRKLFGFRGRSPPLPYMLSSMLQSRAHPKLSSEQGGEDSDVDLDDYSDSDQEEGEDEYDQLPPFKPLRKAQLAKLTNEQKKAYFEEYDYRVKLLQKKQWKEELRRMREMKKRGKDSLSDYGFAEEDPDSGAAAPVAVPLPDMVLPPSFDSDNSAYRYRFLEPTSQFLARPVLDTHGWDHDCGYDGVNVEQSLAIASRYPAVVAVQVTKDKKEFSMNLDSSISVKHGDNGSSMAGFDIQPIGKQLAYIVRGETKFKNLKKNKTAAGVSVTFLGENVATGLKVEDQIGLGKQYALVGSAGTVRSQSDAAYGANIEVQRRELDFPIGQVQSTFGLSIIKWRGDLALGFNSLAQFSIGRNSKVAVRAGINNKLSGQINVRTSSSEHLSLALAGIIPTALAIYRKIWPDVGEKYSIY